MANIKVPEFERYPQTTTSTALTTGKDVASEGMQGVRTPLHKLLLTCTAERSFSTMKWAKKFLRIKMGNEQLTALALLSVHYGKISVVLTPPLSFFLATFLERVLQI
ncbi:hypothetical protein J6590_067750 [Homalodisca vitripennis]|nr:hypothetical protein J6590_067750 [Homalodisca vitripennis]